MPRECLPIRKEALPLSGLLFPTTKNRGVGMKEEDGRQPVSKRYGDSVSGDPDVHAACSRAVTQLPASFRSVGLRKKC